MVILLSDVYFSLAISIRDRDAGPISYEIIGVNGIDVRAWVIFVTTI